MRTSGGCWTCRVRRKRCDEKHPQCDVCSALLITCYFDSDKPEWMDGGVKQEEMAERFKLEVKEKAPCRRATQSERHAGTSTNNDTTLMYARDTSSTSRSSDPDAAMRMEMTPPSSTDEAFQKPVCTRTGQTHKTLAFEGSDSALLTFYLEHILPFLFPFYNPAPLEGGNAWILQLMITSPVMRQVTLCQSSYFFSLARRVSGSEHMWENVIARTRDAFGILRRVLDVFDNSNVAEHLHGATRTLASIVQVQRFEVSVLSFENCQAHLNAAVAVFSKILLTAAEPDRQDTRKEFGIILDRLGPSPWVLPSSSLQIPSAEQAALRFSVALLVFDDIVAATARRTRPALYSHHHDLLMCSEGEEPCIDLEAVIGCQNWVMQLIGETAALDAWKGECQRAGDLNVMDLVQRAVVIKQALEERMAHLDQNPSQPARNHCCLLEVVGSSMVPPQQKSTLATNVWAHAAALYLSVLVSGAQPANPEVAHHVQRILALVHSLTPQSMLRAMVWPFCVAGCLAQPAQYDIFRGLVKTLEPSSLFGTVYKALHIIENAWLAREMGGNVHDSIACLIGNDSELVLLV